MSTLRTNLTHCGRGVATLLVGPLPSRSEWGKLRGQLILQGLLTIIITPPHTEKKMSSCHVPVTSCPTVVPGMFVVGYHGDGCRGHYPGSCGEGAAPPPRPTVVGGIWGGLPWGLFQAECVWSLMPQIPQGPPDFYLWEGVTATYLDRVLGRV